MKNRGFVTRYGGRDRVPICPTCNGVARTTATRFGPRHECCGRWSFNFRPLETYATHEARKIAHEAFDTLWQDLGLERDKAYRLLAEDLDLPKRAAHMAQMDAETAMRVPFATVRIFARLLRDARAGKRSERSIFD